jgi:CheY-like chemotaxis protein
MTKVLIVDDSKLARMAAAKALNALHPDWTRIEAANAADALAVAQEGGVDLALLDFNMPGQDGLSLAADLRAMQPHMVLAVISANTQDEVVARANQAGAAFLPKPLTENALDNFLAGTSLRNAFGA